MQKQKQIDKLSESKWPTQLVFCPKCEKFYIDDLPKGYPLACPDPACKGRLLVRKDFKLKGNTVLDENGRVFKKLW